MVYVEVSKNHGYALDYVIRNKFEPTIRLLIQFYNHKFRLQEREYEKLEEKQEEMHRKGGEQTTWQTQAKY